jgi:hypothetical protein
MVVVLTPDKLKSLILKQDLEQNTFASKINIWKHVDTVHHNTGTKKTALSYFRFLHPPTISSLFGPHILLSTLFSNTLSLCSSLNARDQVSHPYKPKSIKPLSEKEMSYGRETNRKY